MDTNKQKASEIVVALKAIGERFVHQVETGEIDVSVATTVVVYICGFAGEVMFEQLAPLVTEKGAP